MPRAGSTPLRARCPGLLSGLLVLALWLLSLLSPGATFWLDNALAQLPATSQRLIEQAQARYGNATAAMVSDWLELQAGLEGSEPALQLEKINSFFNRRLRFEDDIDIWQQADYWATPLETMSKRAGDCEDFAIAKYVSLRRLGVGDEQLRLIYVHARIGGPQSSISQAHMVLGYFASPDADPLILDNLIDDIRPGSRRPDLSPVFSFNSAGLWVGGASNSSADPSARLSRWRDLLSRMQAEGVELQP